MKKIINVPIPDLVFAVAITVAFCGWWIFIKPATTEERARFLQRVTVTHGHTAATDLRAKFDASPYASLFSIWWSHLQTLSSIDERPLMLASKQVLGRSNSGANDFPLREKAAVEGQQPLPTQEAN